LEDLALLIVKNHLPMHHVESQWIKKIILLLCQRVLHFKIQFSREILLELVEKTKQLYVLPTLVDYYSIIRSFDLWMSKGAYGIFAIVINFWGVN
jgi:hypothetical protein